MSDVNKDNFFSMDADSLSRSVTEIFEQDSEYEESLLNQAQLDDEGVESWSVDNDLEKVCGFKPKFHAFLKTVGNALKKNWQARTVICLYAVCLIIFVINLCRYFSGLVSLKYTNVSVNGFYYVIVMIVPFGVWLWSTSIKAFNYKSVKIGTLIFCFMNLSLLLASLTYLSTCMFLFPLVFSIPVSVDVTASMIIGLARLLVLLLPVLVFVSSFHSFLNMILPKHINAEILRYKVDRSWDLRKDKEFRYDFTVVRKKSNAKRFSVKEDMRPQHTMVLGATGTGKTSMAFNPGIANDLDQRNYNQNTSKHEIEKMLQKQEAVLIKDISDDEFDESCFRGVDKKSQKKIDDIFKKHPLCGMTVVAPNSGFADDVYELAINRGITNINRIDPDLDENGNHKKGFKGLNPLYVRPDLPPFERHQQIINKSRVFADVLQALFEEGGSKDVYFSGLNRQFTSAICTLQIKTMPMLHAKYPSKYPHDYVTPLDFYNVINNFELAVDYCDEMSAYLSEHPEEELNYRNILTLIKRDILGTGAKTMVEQSRGLQNQVSDLLANPLIRDILCNDDCVDFDEALAEGQITLVNYSLSIGDSDSRALGLFVLLLFQGAVFRRPKHQRNIHFMYIDEYPVLLHPKMSKCFTIFRQYRVCMAVALQSLVQFDEKPETMFMKDVMLSNASTQIIFGRSGIAEMELYMKLAGKKFDVVEQDSVSESALSDENTSLSYSTRSSVQEVDAVSGRDIRNKDFSEGSMITVDKGNPVDMFDVVLDFLTDKQKSGLQPYVVDWHKYYNESIADGTVENYPLVAGAEDVSNVFTIDDHKDVFKKSASVVDMVGNISRNDEGKRELEAVSVKVEASVSQSVAPNLSVPNLTIDELLTSSHINEADVKEKDSVGKFEASAVSMDIFSLNKDTIDNALGDLADGVNNASNIVDDVEPDVENLTENNISEPVDNSPTSDDALEAVLKSLNGGIFNNG